MIRRKLFTTKDTRDKETRRQLFSNSSASSVWFSLYCLHKNVHMYIQSEPVRLLPCDSGGTSTVPLPGGVRSATVSQYRGQRAAIPRVRGIRHRLPDEGRGGDPRLPRQLLLGGRRGSGAAGRRLDRTRQVSRRLDRTRQVSRRLDRTRQVSRRLDRTRQVSRRLDRTRQVSRRLDRTRQVSRRLDRTRQVSRRLVVLARWAAWQVTSPTTFQWMTHWLTYPILLYHASLRCHCCCIIDHSSWLTSHSHEIRYNSCERFLTNPFKNSVDGFSLKWFCLISSICHSIIATRK